jgi:hypothetical protein
MRDMPPQLAAAKLQALLAAFDEDIL